MTAYHTQSRSTPRGALALRGVAVVNTPDFYHTVAAELVDFARPAFRPGSGFAWLDVDGAPLAGRPRFLYVTCRMTYVAALEVVRTGATDGPDFDRAAHGIDLLSGQFRDREHGGWFTALADETPAPQDLAQTQPTVVDDRKSAYPHTFVVLAAATAQVARIPGAQRLLADALEVLTTRFWDEDAGMFVEDYSRDFAALDSYRGANSNMHGVEALLAAYGATRDPQYLVMAARIAARIIAVARDFAWRLPEHFTADWRVLPDYNADNPNDPVRPYGSTPGHWLEWARLLTHLRFGLEQAGLDKQELPQPADLLAAAIAFFDRAIVEADGVDGQPGLLFTVDFEGRPLSHSRLHWVTCEGIGAARALAQVTGEARFAQAHERLWEYAATYLMDHEAGSWHHELARYNRPAQSIRVGKADIYHAYQAALLAATPLSVTVIDGLLEKRK